MLDYMFDSLLSWFTNYNILGVVLAVVFGIIWFTPYWTSIFRKPWAWAVLVGSAILSLVAVSFIQIPLQFMAGQAMGYFWSQEVLMRWLLLAAKP
ncbi:hypothetical protein ACFLWZ_01030 [Chloroflexota bacterium]